MAKARIFLLLLVASAFVAVSSRQIVTLDNIFTRMFMRNGSIVDRKVEDASAFVPLMDLNQEVVIYIHGYLEDVDSKSAQSVVHTYLSITNVNVLAVDYRDISYAVYTTSASMVAGVGEAVSKVINQFLRFGVQAWQLHLIGHSLGAHVAGNAGRMANEPIARITGLDPDGRRFDYSSARLQATDARFVQIIHTDTVNYGTISMDGLANFYPNGELRPQPNCSFSETVFSDADTCSHRRSVEYYVESIYMGWAFIGVQCDSYLAFLCGLCIGNNERPMGFGTPSDTAGNFYLLTNGQSPYGRGNLGIVTTKHNCTNYISNENWQEM